VFTRYGYARTTMADIASKAGMSRPALYLLFPDKDAIFARVIEGMDERKLREIDDALAGLETLEDKLLRACLDRGLHGVELAAAHPDAADLFDLRFPAVRQVYANFEALVVMLIAEPVARSALDVRPAELARTLVYGMRGLRAASPTVEDMRRLVEVQVKTLIRAIQPADGRHARVIPPRP
jgi:AcrR family transcriptional regulator